MSFTVRVNGGDAVMRESVTWDEFRRQMPVTGNWAYFDHAGVAPLSGPALEVLREWAEDAACNGVANWARWARAVEETRQLGAQLLSADEDEIALIRNTTEGVNIVAEGFPWRAGDNVVVPAQEFPTNLYPWMNLKSRGVEVRLVETQDERLKLRQVEDACDGRTRMIAVSWVGYRTGWRNDVDALAEIAHRHSAYLFLDAIQGLGVLPLDMRQTPVDFLAGDGHKWLLGPEGAGLFAMRKEHLGLLRPTGLGWNSVQQSGNFSDTRLVLKESAGRYEGGTCNTGGIAALGASLRLLLSIGVERIEQRLLDVTDELCARLKSIGAEIACCRDGGRRSGIVAFTLSGRDPAELKKQCKQRGVILNHRAGRVRVSPHVYTNGDDLDRLIAALMKS